MWVSTMGEKSLLDEILDDFTESLSKAPSFGSKIAQSLKEIIKKGEYRNKEPIVELLMKKESKNENS
jgi:hypothetical protein